MTLQSRVTELDDYSGELGQALEKLRIEHDRGAINRDEQLDFLGDLRRTIDTRDLRPLSRRGRIALLAGLVLGGGGYFVPSSLHYAMALRIALIVMAVLSLAVSGWTYLRYAKVRRRDMAWLKQLEGALAKGGTIFDTER